MRCLLTIAKWTPAALCGLLVVAWVVSVPCSLSATAPWGQNESVTVCFYSGCVSIWRDGINIGRGEKLSIHTQWKGHHLSPAAWLGRPDLGPSYFPFRPIQCPIAPSITLLLPLSIGPFIRFRFPLWSWFAFTTLIAVELAYYLR
jgi:hypothetical protein